MKNKQVFLDSLGELWRYEEYVSKECSCKNKYTLTSMTLPRNRQEKYNLGLRPNTLQMLRKLSKNLTLEPYTYKPSEFTAKDDKGK